jgi:phage protein D
MTNLQDLTTSQLNRIIAIKEQIETLQAEIESVVSDGGAMPVSMKPGKKRKRRLSAAGRAAIIAGTKARWARMKSKTDAPKAAKKKDRRSSPAVRAKLSAAAKARWARVRAAGETKL